MPSPADQLPPDASYIARRLAKLEREVRELRAARRLPHSAIDDGALVVRDASGSLRAVIGQQPDGTTAVNMVNGPPPPTPTAATVTAALASLDVTWDGLFTDAATTPLDWMRVEVHVGASEDFTPDQTTLQSTIETPQGGTVNVSLPYTEWWVKLRSRSTSGTVGPDSVAVAGTPRQADAADIVAGAITADLIDVDALNGKTINGATFNGGTINGIDINGSTVTGGVLQTNSSGSRVVVTPNPPVGMVNRPTVLLYSGVTGEAYPAALNSGPNVLNSAQPTTALGAPITAQDSSGNYTQAVLSLSSPKAGSYPGLFAIGTNAPTTTSEIGYAAINASSATTTSGTSNCNIYVKDGNATGHHSSVYVTGDYVNINANGSDHTFTSGGLSLTGSISARNTPAIIYKASSTDRASTVTLANDPDLTGTFLANVTYLVEIHMYVGAGAGLMTTAWSVPSGSTGIRGAMGAASSATEVTAGNNNADGILMRGGAHNFTTTVTYGRRNTNTNLVYVIETGIVSTTTAGTFALQWAQSTSSATNTRMGLGSWIRFTRLTP